MSRSAPRFSRFLLSLVIPRDQHDTVLGDLDEEYVERMRDGLGRVRARLWYWRECTSLSSAFTGDRTRDWLRRVGRARNALRGWFRRSSRKNAVTVQWNINDAARKGRKPEMGVILKELRFGLRSLAKQPSSA